MPKPWEQAIYPRGQAIYPSIPQRGTDGTGPSYGDSPGNDGGGWFAKICGTLNIGFDTVKSELRAMRMDAARNTQAPVLNWYPQSVVIAANGIGVIRFGGPDQGHYWYIKKLTVAGITPTTVAAGRADVFISAADMRSVFAAGATSSMDWRDQAPTLPTVLPYGNAVMPLRLNEELFVVFSGATPGATYVSCIGYFDFEESSARQEWSI